MARPISSGIVSIHDEKEADSGFGCMKLIEFLTDEGVTDWDDWHYRHNQAARGECHYKDSQNNLPVLDHCREAKLFICSPAFAEAVRKEYSNWQNRNMHNK